MLISWPSASQTFFFWESVEVLVCISSNRFFSLWCGFGLVYLWNSLKIEQRFPNDFLFVKPWKGEERIILLFVFMVYVHNLWPIYWLINLVIDKYHLHNKINKTFVNQKLKRKKNEEFGWNMVMSKRSSMFWFHDSIEIKTSLKWQRYAKKKWEKINVILRNYQKFGISMDFNPFRWRKLENKSDQWRLPLHSIASKT